MDSDIGEILQIFIVFVNCRYFEFLLIFRMGKKRKKNKKTQEQPLPAKNESEKQPTASAANVSNSISAEAHPDLPTLQDSVPRTGEVSTQETITNKMSDLEISESAAQNYEQQKSESLSGTNFKTLIYGGGERLGQKLHAFQIYTVSSREQKAEKPGKKIKLRVNHFLMTINVPGRVIHHYDVEFEFSEKIVAKRLDRKLLLEAINILKKKYFRIFGNPHAVVFDGLKNIYTCKMLNFASKEFEGEIEIKEHADALKVPQIKVILQHVGSVNVNDAIEEYCKSSKTERKPKDAIKALNIVLSMAPRLHYETVGRNHFNPNSENGTAIDIGGGASLWVGTFISVRLGWKPMLNADVANKIGFDEGKMVDFIERVLSSNSDYDPSHILLNEERHRDAVDTKIKGLKIRYNCPGGYKRDFRAIKMMQGSNKLRIKRENGEECTIEKHFKDTYDHQLEFPNYPCVHVGNPEKTIYLPIEMCMIKKQVLPKFKRIDDKQRTAVIKAAAKPPIERRATIEQNLRNFWDNYNRDPYAEAFGIRVSGEMMRVDGRILDPPSLTYKNVDFKEVEFTEIYRGKWSSGTFQDWNALKFLNPVDLKYWGVLDLANIPDNIKRQFVDRLYSEGKIRGMLVEYPTYCKANPENLSQVKETFIKLHDHISKNYGPAQLIMVMTAQKGPLRGELKYLGDVTLKIPNQFVLKDTVFRKDNRDQILHNLCLKINHKLGGVNHALCKRPPIMNRPVMVVGADVTHPAPDDDSERPSIAAVVGSTDPNVSQFNVEVRLQKRVDAESENKSKGRVIENILQMEEIMRSLLIRFYQKTREKPEQIIYYRDGVSEGQFPEVLNHELSAIRTACTTLELGYEPKVTFIIAQKRHKTRFFVENQDDGVGKTRNVPAGTVVDTKITTFSEIDFFLASHEGIKVFVLKFSFG